MIASMIILFVLGYLLIACEHPLHINKATIALIMCGVLWSIYSLMSGDPTLEESLQMHLGETSEILFFLIGAMTIVEIIDRYGGFSVITERINARNKKHLMWILSILAFVMSAVLDNMTTTIIMVMMLRRLLSDKKERWLFASVIVIAANAGGAFSPIGDVTTIMLWMADKVTTASLFMNLIIPSIVALVVPVWIATAYIQEGKIQTVKTVAEKNPEIARQHPHLSKAMLVIGVLGLLFVPVFKTITHLPPYLGIVISLGVIWLITEICIHTLHIDPKLGGRVTSAIRGIDMATILFFLGILMAVSALSQAGILSRLASDMNNNIHQPLIIASAIGILSAVVDNVPLVAACIQMFGELGSLTDPYYCTFVEDGLFWHLLTFCAGVGGSLLIIGSAAGVVAMGIERIPFFWYVKRITLLAFAGYVAGVLIIWLEDICPYFM